MSELVECEMTIRQQYAMAAMQGMIAKHGVPVTADAFKIADAMIRHEEDEAARKDWRGGKTISGSSL